jgi:DNA polymerase III alpha subunit
MGNKGFTHLHLHSQYSLLDGTIVFDEPVKQVLFLGLLAVLSEISFIGFGAVDVRSHLDIIVCV